MTDAVNGVRKALEGEAVKADLVGRQHRNTFPPEACQESQASMHMGLFPVLGRCKVMHCGRNGSKIINYRLPFWCIL